MAEVCDVTYNTGDTLQGESKVSPVLYVTSQTNILTYMIATRFWY